MLRLAACELLTESGGLTIGACTRGDAVQNQRVLEINFLVSGFELVKGRYDVYCIVVAFFIKEPSWRLGKVESSDNEDGTEDYLEGNGKPSGQVVRAVGGTVIDPVSKHSAERN